MPASKKPRKKYRPLRMTRQDRADTVMTRLNISGTGSMDKDKVRDLILTARGSLENIEKGKGLEPDLYQLALASNIALLLAERGMGPELIPQIREGQHALMTLHKRLMAKQSLVLTGPGILAVRTMLDVYEAQVEHEEFTSGHAYTAYMKVLERMATGHVLEIPE